MSHDKSYQIECRKCRNVAALEARADLLQTFIRRVLPRSFSPRFTDEMTLRQRGAVDWSFAIGNCLRQAMATHPRCDACGVLMGPGHAEGGMQPLCGTHGEVVMPRRAVAIVL
jgi:hypothetical protein